MRSGQHPWIVGTYSSRQGKPAGPAVPALGRRRAQGLALRVSGLAWVRRMSLVFALDGVDLAGKRPRITGRFPAQDLSGHAQVIGRVSLHPGSAQVDEPAGRGEDRAPVAEQRLRDQPCRLPGGNGQPGGDLRDRRRVRVGLERRDGAVNERLDQLWVSTHGLGA